jgi:fused signal recognition particle receptor
LLAAADTFRAAAIEQLQVWGDRAGCSVIASKLGADPAGLVFDAMNQAVDDQFDVLLIDTAGRLQNKKDLMAELEKIVRVMRKVDKTAPHSVILVMDATVGQNAHSQVELFKEAIDVSGLIITKLDGTARGGVIVALAEKFSIPVHAIGVGEAMEDLHPFEAQTFACAMMGMSVEKI